MKLSYVRISRLAIKCRPRGVAEGPLLITYQLNLFVHLKDPFASLRVTLVW